MKHYRLISSILRGPFLIEQGYAHSFLPSIIKLLNHEPANFYGDQKPGAFIESIVDDNKKANASFILSPAGDNWRVVRSIEEAASGSVHVMRLHGAVMKEDYCGVPGTATLRNELIQAKNEPKIIGSVFSTDTGGGHVDGTFELVDEIAAYGKPIVGYVDGMSCSAGYAMMSRCKEIMLAHKTTSVGSIGTAISFYDYTKMYEERGIKLIYINSTTSPDKNQDYFEALEGNTAPIQEDLDFLNEIFQSSVKAGRPKIKKEAITGKCFRGDKAISLGMADRIGSLNDAVNRVMELAN